MRAVASVISWVLLLACFALSETAEALPMYALRSGRTCGNCHVSPTYEDPKGWNNPELSKRKCNMSCSVCHVNPTGGGLRNTSGRYYGQSTLSMYTLQERSYSDHGRELLSASTIRRLREMFGSAKRRIPSNFESVRADTSPGAQGSWSTFGRPLNSPSEYAFWDGRYGDLNPDPLVQIGGDFRFAYWSGSKSYFPMQADLGVAVHPMEHLTLMATAAGRGRTGGIAETIGQERTPVFARNAFAMVHELPYMAYAKVGVFQPAFGTYIADHTSFIRRFFELDLSTSDDTVLGFEVGAAPNYPFANFSVFRNLLPPGLPEGTSAGFGAAGSFGWRDLAWNLSGHFMVKRRDQAGRGDLSAAGIAWGFNPFELSNSIPLTYMGELSVGRRQRILTGADQDFFGMYHEVWLTIFNGVSARAKYDLGERDINLDSGLEQRVTLTIDVSPAPGVTVIAQGRIMFDERGGGRESDVFIHTHLWF